MCLSVSPLHTLWPCVRACMCPADMLHFAAHVLLSCSTCAEGKPCPACRSSAPIIGATSLPAVSSATNSLNLLWDGYVDDFGSPQGAWTAAGNNPYIQLQLAQAYSDIEVRSMLCGRRLLCPSWRALWLQGGRW